MNILQAALQKMYGVYNDKLLAYFKKYGASSSVLGDAEKEYLVGKLGKKYIANQDYWRELNEKYGDILPLEVSDILSKYGSNAHLYLPGVGVVNGFTAGNYRDSAGTTPATVDNPVGLVLDGAGSVGSELAPSLASSTGWSAQAGWTVSGGTASVNSSVAGSTYLRVVPSVAGNTYRVTFTVSSFTSGSLYFVAGGIGTPSPITSVGTYSCNITAKSTTGVGLYALSTNTIATISAISIKEVTGIHASQSTAGFRPTLRKGIVNLLLNNKWDGGGTAPTGWTAFGAGGAQGSALPNGCYTRTFAPVAALDFINSNFTTLPNTTYTIVLYVESNSGLLANELIGSGTIPAGATFAISGTTAPSGNYLFATLTVGATGGTFTLRCGAGCSGPVTGSVTLSQPAIFSGTLTAAQILQYGGIPTTTTAAASSSLGPSYLEFKAASTHRLALSDTPFSATLEQPYALVVSGEVGTLGASCYFFGDGARFFGLAAGGILRMGHNNIKFVDSVATLTPGTKFVAAFVWDGATAKVRLNGAVQKTDSLAAPTGAVGVANVGASNNAAFYDGNIYYCAPIKGTLSDADILLLEKFAGSLAGVTL